jgi:hypothetical protein
MCIRKNTAICSKFLLFKQLFSYKNEKEETVGAVFLKKVEMGRVKQQSIFIIILCSLFFLMHCSFGSQGSGLDNVVGESISSDDISINSDITAINASLQQAQIYLVLNSDENNLKKIVDDQVSSVFDELAVSTSSTSTQSLTTSTTQIAIDTLVQGPNGESILVLQDAVTWQSTECLAFYYQSDDSGAICLIEDNYELIERPQFDLQGNIYFHGYVPGSEYFELVRWDADSQTTEQLINEYTVLTKWLVHPSGTVYLLGDENEDNIFRRVDITIGSVENVLNSSATVSDFMLVDQNHLVFTGRSVSIDGERESGTFVLVLSGSGEGDITELSHSFSDLSNAKKDEEGRIYLLDESKIYAIYPGEMYEVYTGMDVIDSFDIVDGNLYLVGEFETEPALFRKNLATNEIVNLTSEQTIQVYDFAILGEYVYFYGLEFTSNSVMLGKININTASIEALETFNGLDLVMQVKGEPYYSTYTDVEDVSLEIDEGYDVQDGGFDIEFYYDLLMAEINDAKYLIYNDAESFHIYKIEGDELEFIQEREYFGGSSGYSINLEDMADTVLKLGTDSISFLLSYNYHGEFYDSIADNVLFEDIESETSFFDDVLFAIGYCVNDYSENGAYLFAEHCDGSLSLWGYELDGVYEDGFDEELSAAFSPYGSSERYLINDYYNDITSIEVDADTSLLYLVANEISSSSQKLLIFDIANINQIELQDSLDLIGSEFNMLRQDDFVYLVSTEGYIQIVDVSMPQAMDLTSITQVMTPDNSDLLCSDFTWVDDKLIILASDESGDHVSVFYLFEILGMKLIQSYEADSSFDEFEVDDTDEGFTVYSEQQLIFTE